MFVNKVIVMTRYEDGEDIKVSVKATDRPFDSSHLMEMFSKIKAVPHSSKDCVLYFTVRRTLWGVKDNWKCKTFDELNNLLPKVFDN